MEREIEATGKDVQDAVDKALQELGVTIDKVNVDIICQGGMFKKAKVKVKLQRPQEENEFVVGVNEEVETEEPLTQETKVEEVPFNPIIEWAEGDGVTFDKNDVLYKTPEVLQVMPRAYEVWLQLPTSVSGNGGVIFGSYTGKPGPNYTKLDIIEHGVPVLSVNGVSVEFSEVDVRSDDFVHLAICIT